MQKNNQKNSKNDKKTVKNDLNSSYMIKNNN